MRKKKVLLTALVAATMAFSTFGMASCDLGDIFGGIFGQENPAEDEMNLTWTVDDNATVKVEGADALPTTAAKGATVVFTVTAPKGWDAVVKVNNSKVMAENGKYSVEIKRNTKINVELVEIVSSVSVTGPESFVYYAGETINPEDWEVTVYYETGRSEVTDAYTVNYGGETGFAIGDTEFTFEVGGVKSDPVRHAAAVEAKVTIDSLGGTIAQDYFEALQARNDLHNVAMADGVITFTYAKLDADVALPTADQITKGEDGDYVFKGWTNSDTVASTQAVSSLHNAKYEAALLKLDKMYYENIVSGDETIPCLVVEGEFKAAKTAYLYLYEGNDKVELIGDTVGDDNTQRGDKFKLTFDMRKLVEKDYKGKWMDIKFRAQFGDRIETQEIILENYTAEFVDSQQAISNGDYTYSFQVWSADGKSYLKAVYTDFITNYSISTGNYTFSEEEGEKLALVFSGTTASKYAGGSIVLDFWMGSSISSTEGTIAADGSWTVYFDVSTLPLETDGYGHIKIKDAEGTVIYPDSGEANIDNGGLVGDYETFTVGLINGAKALRFEDGSKSRTFYVGAGKWGGIVAYGRDENDAEKITTNTMELKVEGEKLYMVFDGTYGSAYTKETAQAKFEETGFYYSLQVYPSWAYRWYSTDMLADESSVMTVTFNDDGTFQIVCDLSEAEFEAGDIVYGHMGTSSESNSNSTIGYSEHSVTYNGLTFTVGAANGDCDSWMGGLTIIYVTVAE